MDIALGIHHDDSIDGCFENAARPFLAGAKRFFVLLALSHVARNFRKALKRAGRIAQRRQHHVGPVASAILAHPPAFFFIATITRCDFKGDLCSAARDVLRKEHNVRRPTDGFFRSITFNPFGSGIPGGDASVGIQHVNGVVAHAFHEHAK